MGLWTNKNHRTILDDAEDFGDYPIGGRLKQWLAGVFLPFWPILFGALSLKLGRATFFGTECRGSDSSLDIHGMPAVTLNIAYIAFGCLLHFHFFWGLEPVLRRFSQWGKVISMIVLVPCLVYSIWRVISDAS
jgi:hypothetical protein